MWINIKFRTQCNSHIWMNILYTTKGFGFNKNLFAIDYKFVIIKHTSCS